MDFAVLPPEVNSARMYAGPGSGPMLAAAMAWDELAAALQSTANSYQAEITALTSGPWVGPSAAAMVAAIAPYLEWMRTAGAQAEETATKARAAAFAYETAFAETVPPPVITANRTLLATLVATNFLGQNTPAIATTETQYAEMWARDTAAMFGYAGSTASATTLTPFAQPEQTTSSDADQPQPVAQATGTAAGSTRNAVGQQPFSAVPNMLTRAAAGPNAVDPSVTDVLGLESDLITVFLNAPASVSGLGVAAPSATVALPFDIAGALTGFHTDDIISGWAGVQSWPGTGAVPPSPFPVITNPAGGFGTLASAGLAEANTVGGLSVPPGWTAPAPAIRPAALALPAASVGAAAEAAAAAAPSGTGSLFGEMAVASIAGRAMAGTGTLGRERSKAETAQATRDPNKKDESATTPQVSPGGPISIAAELRELASLRDAGILTLQEFDEQRMRLLPT
ncbi:PPE domain-containing protein [Mycobacterium intracellulare]|uniref:PPE family protein, SVP subgroup n=1 Tax=Mycobacterium intracellulare TaxID=1767 RepID=UPI001CD976E3|nr:PPE domain-containing protein [Mycobacterium intracellulare]MCA2307163.1 PPE domain-containing protein [Mycobacterium intracellulare]MCA2349476.1 PPE domain-containing protein [Mycobacterium intracellulare]